MFALCCCGHDPPRLRHRPGFLGVLKYVAHDAGHAETEERVAFRMAVNLDPGPDLAPCSPDHAARVMAATVSSAMALKKLAGIKATGRKLTDPVFHYTLSWQDHYRPTQDEIERAVYGSLEALGLEDRQAYIVGHDDSDHFHVHVVVNRVSPDDGRAAKVYRTGKALQEWALEYEKTCPNPIPVPDRGARTKVRLEQETPGEEARLEGRPEGREDRRLRTALPEHPPPRRRHRPLRDRVTGQLVAPLPGEMKCWNQLRENNATLAQMREAAERLNHERNALAGYEELCETRGRLPELPAPESRIRLELARRARAEQRALAGYEELCETRGRLPELPAPESRIRLELARRARAEQRALAGYEELCETRGRLPELPAPESRIRLELARRARAEQRLAEEQRKREAEAAKRAEQERLAPPVAVPRAPFQSEQAPGAAEVPAFSARGFISALTDPAALQKIRRQFQEMDPQRDLKPLVVEVIDPQLLRVVLGPALAPQWVPELEKVYSRIRERPPADFPDIDNVWQRQRAYWHAPPPGKPEQNVVSGADRPVGGGKIAPVPARTPVQAPAPPPASTPPTPVQPPAAPTEPALRSRDLIQALGKPEVLRGLRRRFQEMDPQRDLKPLVVEVIDPQLLGVALGPALASRWASGLEKVYATMREQHPALFDDIDEKWRRQREYWHGLEQAHRVELEDRPDESDVQPVPPPAAAAPIVEPPAAPAEERRVAGEHDEATTEPARRDASPPPATAPAPEPAAVSVTEVERVRLAAQAVEAQLPWTRPYSGDSSHRPPAVPDERFERLAAATADEFARKVIAEVQARQHYYSDSQRTESEKTYLRPAITGKHQENRDAYEKAAAERGLFTRRPAKPTWAAAAAVASQEFEGKLLGVIEDVCRDAQRQSPSSVRREPEPERRARREEAVVRGQGRPAGGDSSPATVREPKPPMSWE